jgi:hypothetical protein
VKVHPVFMMKLWMMYLPISGPFVGSHKVPCKYREDLERLWGVSQTL